MEVSRLSFRKETMDKMTKKMGPREKGRLLYQKLEEIASNGVLQKCKTRAEVANAVGYIKGQEARGYSWVSNMINRGYLAEVISGIGEFSYFLGNKKPDYSYKGRKKAGTDTTKKEVVKTDTDTVVVNNTPISDSSMKLVVTIDNRVTISLENANADTIRGVVNEILLSTERGK